MKIFYKQIAIYTRLLKNFNRVAKIKSLYFYIYTMPIFGFLFYLIVRLLLKINSKKMIIFFLQHKIFLSSIRFLSIESRKTIGSILPKYNDQNDNIQKNFTIDDKKNLELLNDLKEYGYISLGKIFTDNECENFIQFLENKTCYNSQTAMQSSGNQINFELKKEKDNLKKNAYYCFNPEVTTNYEPFKKFISSKKIISLIDSYLNFKSEMYSSITWYNPQSNEDHYVHRKHRDHDDFKFLGMIIYWTNVDKNSGCLNIVEKSHEKSNQFKNKDLIGQAGTVYLVDFSSLHSGTKLINNHRITSFIRFGKFFNHATVIDGWSHTPL